MQEELNKDIKRNIYIYKIVKEGRSQYSFNDTTLLCYYFVFRFLHVKCHTFKEINESHHEVLYKILIEFGIPKKLVRLIKMSLTETYSRVRVGKNVSDRFLIRNGFKQGDALSPMLFNFGLEYAIRRVQLNQDGLKLNGTNQLLAYTGDVNILGETIHTLKENAEALVATTREIGLEVCAD